MKNQNLNDASFSVLSVFKMASKMACAVAVTRKTIIIIIIKKSLFQANH